VENNKNTVSIIKTVFFSLAVDLMEINEMFYYGKLVCKQNDTSIFVKLFILALFCIL
jgi:hypothetical protein